MSQIHIKAVPIDEEFTVNDPWKLAHRLQQGEPIAAGDQEVIEIARFLNQYKGGISRVFGDDVALIVGFCPLKGECS